MSTTSKFIVPKDLKKNLLYRRKIIEAASHDKELQDDLWAKSARDVVFWLDTFGFTYSPKDFPDTPNRPFILWPYQERALLTMNKALGKHPILIEKSRDMGATWLVMSLFVWRWLFRGGQSFLVGSRKQELVDKTGDPKTLFAKADYLLERLPGWMLPSYERNLLALHNNLNGSTIDGESTNDDFARGDRRTAILLDEFPAVDNGYQILKAVGDATSCPIFAGTSQGAAGAYYDVRSKMMEADPDRVLRFFWTDHPKKSKGLYTSKDYKLQIIDTAYDFKKNHPDGYKFILDEKLRSVAYDEREKAAANKQEMAQEWDIDYLLSGWNFFDPNVIERLKKETCRAPIAEGQVLGTPDWRKPEWYEQRGGHLKLWFHPIDGKVPENWNDCVVACDVSTGKGGEMTSNSVAAIYRRTTGEKIAELTTNIMSPSDFCKSVLALCKWCNDAFLIWEENGPGGEFTKQVKETDYRNIYYRNESETMLATKKTRKPGWWSNKETKRLLLSDYAKALIEGKLINRSHEAVHECSQYVHQPNGVIEHSRAKNTPDPTVAGENHGDRVIADALAWCAIADRARPEVAAQEPEAAPGTFGWRRLFYRRKDKHTRPWGY
jgi:hypothetical protein